MYFLEQEVHVSESGSAETALEWSDKRELNHALLLCKHIKVCVTFTAQVKVQERFRVYEKFYLYTFIHVSCEHILYICTCFHVQAFNVYTCC